MTPVVRLAVRVLIVAAGAFIGWLLSWFPLAALWMVVPLKVDPAVAYAAAWVGAVVVTVLGAALAWRLAGRRI